MKKALIGFFILLVVFVTVPSADARVWELGGNAAVELRFADFWEDGANLYPFRGHVATFINPNTTVGAFINASIEDDGTGNYTRTEIELGPRVGYYFEKKGFGYPFVWGRASYGHIMTDSETKGQYSDGHFTLTAGGGYMYLLNQYNAINVGAYFEQHWYDFYTRGWDSGQKLALQFGFLFYIY